MKSATWGFVSGVLVWALGCGGGATDEPVDIAPGNVTGYWYGTKEIPMPEAAGEPLQGPVFLHLGGALPGVDGLDAIAEWVKIAPFELGRHRLDGDRLVVDAFVPGTGWNPARTYKVESLTRSTMVLLAETTPPERYRLTRGESCAAGGVWWALKPRLDAAAFGPDGQLHLLQEGAYSHGVAGLCYPFSRSEITSSKIAVGPDDRVLLAHVELGAIALQRFKAPKGSMDPITIEETTLELREAQDTWIYDHLRLGYAGTTPVVLYARGATLHTWFEEDGAWLYEALTMPRTDNLTPTDIEVVAAPGELWVRRRGHENAFVFDGAWRVEALPAHPSLGVPTVLAFDDKGGMHGAWIELRRELAVWDPLVVGRFDGTSWTTAYAGVGSPWDMKVGRDGTYDVVVAIARMSTSLGHVRVEALAPAKWSTHYGPDRFATSTSLGGEYLMEGTDALILMQPWAIFSSDGALLVGGGGEPPLRAPFGLWKNPNREEAKRTGDRRLKIEMAGPLGATVRFPSWGLSCKTSCEHLVPSQSIVPIVVESDGLVMLTPSTPETVGISHTERLPDGTWVAVFEPDMFGPGAFDVTLTVTAEPRAVALAELLEPDDESSRPIAAVGGDTVYVLREVGASRRLERYDDEGELLAGIELAAEGFAAGNKVLAVTESELVVLSANLAVESRTAFARPTRPYRLAVGPSAAVTVERLDDGLTGRIAVHSSAGVQNHEVPLPKLGPVVVAGQAVAVASDTESYARTVGVAEVPAHHLTVAGYGLDGVSKWTLALPKSAFRQPRLAANGAEVVWVVTQYQPFNFAAQSPFAGLPPMTGAALTHVFRIGADGRFTVVTTERGPVVNDGSIAATADDVWFVTASDAHIDVTSIDREGEVAHRAFSARRPGECIQGACPDESAIIAPWGDGLAIVHHQRARALPIEEMVLPAVLPPLSGRTALIRVRPL